MEATDNGAAGLGLARCAGVVVFRRYGRFALPCFGHGRSVRLSKLKRDLSRSMRVFAFRGACLPVHHLPDLALHYFFTTTLPQPGRRQSALIFLHLDSFFNLHISLSSGGSRDIDAHWHILPPKTTTSCIVSPLHE